MYVCMYVCIHPVFPPQAGCNAKSVFIPTIANLNSEFYFFQISHHTKIKETNLPYSFSHG